MGVAGEKIAKIEQLIRVALQEADGQAALKACQILAQGLAASCERENHLPLAQAVQALSDSLAPLVGAGAAIPDERRRHLEALLDAVHLAAGATLAPHAAAQGDDEPGGEQNLIYLVEHDAPTARDLSTQINCFGYSVVRFDTPLKMAGAAQKQLPAAIVYDLNLADDALNQPCFEIIQDLRAQHRQPVPVIFLSEDSNIETRLAAARASGDAFYAKPVDVGRLIDKLDSLLNREEQDPFRVLIVDDSPVQAKYYASILEKAGIRTFTVTQPLEIMLPLMDFHPDLVLLDMYMPDCSGRELATVIRQQESLVSVPIVFLSSESDKDKQHAAMANLGDGFIKKDVKPDHLISEVVTRIERSRTLRSFMVRDSLTGLFNHTTIKRRLDTELQRARRYGHPLAMAMIDIDNFKKINDSYGHPVGDSVIKSLTRLLQQRLRKSDIIGRYGGEEFAVIMPETNGTTAVRILDRIRESFAQVLHVTEHAEFSAQFSCGVAEFPQYDDAAELNNAADAALYEAKRSGRNRIVLHR